VNPVITGSSKRPDGFELDAFARLMADWNIASLVTFPERCGAGETAGRTSFQNAWVSANLLCKCGQVPLSEGVSAPYKPAGYGMSVTR
jgi:hypothetical protein